MFTINWANFILRNIPYRFLGAKRVATVTVYISQVSGYLYSAFMVYRTATLNTLIYNSQEIYLTKILNDTFSPSVGGIYIATQTHLLRSYVSNKIEVRQKRYLCNKWLVGTPFVTGEYCVYGSHVYVAIASTTGDQPDTSPTKWSVFSDKVYLKNKSEYAGQLDFIVYVPSAVTFDTNYMKGMVNFYKLAGKRYSIVTY